MHPRPQRLRLLRPHGRALPKVLVPARRYALIPAARGLLQQARAFVPTRPRQARAPVGRRISSSPSVGHTRRPRGANSAPSIRPCKNMCSAAKARGKSSFQTPVADRSARVQRRGGTVGSTTTFHPHPSSSQRGDTMKKTLTALTAAGTMALATVATDHGRCPLGLVGPGPRRVCSRSHHRRRPGKAVFLRVLRRILPGVLLFPLRLLSRVQL